MAGDDLVLYTYSNVGFEIPSPADPQDELNLYTYSNIGLFAAPGAVGRVLGFPGRYIVGTLYTYQNILEYVYPGHGTTRTIHDGTDRTIHDDTERTI